MTQLLDRLNIAIGEIHTSLSVRHVLDTTLKWAEELLQAEASAIFLPQSHSNILQAYIRNRQGKKSHLLTFRLSKTQGLEAWVLTAGKSTLVNNPQEKSQLLKNADLPPLKPIRNLMATPLKAKSKILGVLQVMNRRASKSFSSKHLHFLEMLALQAATALANAQTYSTQHAFIHEQKKQLLVTTDQLRRANEKLREVDQAKSESISMVAHELRSPITSITGFAKIMHKGKLGPLTKEQMEFCGIILKNAEHIQRLINDLLDLAKLELGKLEMHFEAVSCRELIKEAVFSIQGSTPLEKQRIKMELPATEIFVEGDRLRLVQVLINLLSNALKYSPPSSPVFTYCEYDTHSVIFSVEDRGIALTPDQQKKVFEKFYRVKHTSTTDNTGSGLGLAISRITINNHGGHIWVEASPQGGNNFRFRLKRVAGPAVPPL